MRTQPAQRRRRDPMFLITGSGGGARPLRKGPKREAGLAAISGAADKPPQLVGAQHARDARTDAGSPIGVQAPLDATAKSMKHHRDVAT